MRLPNVLIVEDEHALAVAVAASVRQVSAESDLAPTAAQARRLLESKRRYHAMVLDIGLPDENGLDFLATLDPEIRPPTVVITAHGDIQNAIAARKLGVTDFLTKPLDFREFQAALCRLLPSQSGSPESKSSAESAVPDSAAFVGAANAMRAVFQQIAHSCASDDPVLVRGETGTGKSHAARLIQGNSLGSGPCGSLSAGPTTTTKELIEALDDTAGGVLVVEEISQLAPEVQAELVRLGESATDSKLPRLIATTTNDLRELVSEDKFRSDLYYRLQVLEVRLPPLRERMDDLPALVSYFVGQLVPERSLEFTDDALAQLAAHGWPGNLRELRNSIAYALTVRTGTGPIDATDLPAYLTIDSPPSKESNSFTMLTQALDEWVDSQFELSDLPVYRQLAESLEAMLIRRLLKRYDGKLARLASALKANRTTLRKRLQEG